MDGAKWMRAARIALALALAVPAAGWATEIRYETGAVWGTEGISSVSSTGGTLVGTTAMVGFDGGGTQVVAWVASGDGGGGAFGAGWSLAVDGATYINSAAFDPWVFSVNPGVSVAWLSIDVGAGDAVFDATRTYASDPVNYPSTPGSQSGTPFAYWGMDDSFGTVATYSGAVALDGQAPVGDLYRMMTVEFGQTVSGTTLAFSADTDTASTELTPIPEPATLVLVGTGLAVAAWPKRRLRRG